MKARSEQQWPGPGGPGRQAIKLLVAAFLALGFLGLAWGLLPAAAQADNGITAPAAGDTVGGVVIIEGTADDPSFLRYEVAFLQEANPVGWISFAEGDRPVNNGTLAVWDTTVGRNVNAPVFPDGQYRLRLRVVRTDYNYDEYVVTGITISNGEPTPTPTITPTVTSDAPTVPAVTAPAQPAVLPTLTPFPTPSPQPTPADRDPLAAGAAPVVEERQGVLEQLSAVDAGQFTNAFWQGVMVVVYLFGALGLYLLLRSAIRRLWRRMVARMTRERN
jgi:hypothetical protein